MAKEKGCYLLITCMWWHDCITYNHNFHLAGVSCSCWLWGSKQSWWKARMVKNRGQPLRTEGSIQSVIVCNCKDLQLISSKKMRPSVLQLQGNERWQEPQGICEWFLPQLSIRIGTGPWPMPWPQPFRRHS